MPLRPRARPRHHPANRRAHRLNASPGGFGMCNGSWADHTNRAGRCRPGAGQIADKTAVRLRNEAGCLVYSGQLGRRFHVRRSRTAVRRRAGLALRIKLGGFLDPGKIVLADHRYFPRTAQRIHDAETGDFVPAKCKKVYLSHATRPGRPYVVGVPLLRSWETAVTSCAGANGLVKRTLLGTPCEPYSSALAPVI